MIKLTLHQLILIELILISAIVVAVLSFNILAHVTRTQQLDKLTELVANPQSTMEEQQEVFQDVKDIKAHLNITDSSLS